MNHATHIRDAVLRHFLATGEEATVKHIVTRLQEMGHLEDFEAQKPFLRELAYLDMNDKPYARYVS